MSKTNSKFKIRSFVNRASRLSKGQLSAINGPGRKFCLPYEEILVNFPETFGRHAPTILEIGFGMGEASAEIACSMPEKNFLGVEVYTPGVGSLIRLINENSITNLRIIQHDAVEVLEKMVAPESLSGVNIFFPDPWHKVRHNKRRLVQGPLVRLLASRIISGGYLHCATDWREYADQMLAVLQAEPLFRNTSDSYTERPAHRPVTKFENRGLLLGHEVWDLLFEKV